MGFGIFIGNAVSGRDIRQEVIPRAMLFEDEEFAMLSEEEPYVYLEIV